VEWVGPLGFAFHHGKQWFENHDSYDQDTLFQESLDKVENVGLRRIYLKSLGAYNMVIFCPTGTYDIP